MVRIVQNKRGSRTGYTAYVHVPIPGREPYRKSKTLPTKDKAKAWGDAEERRVYDDMTTGRLGHKPRAVPTLAEFAPRFVDEHARANRHKASGVADKVSILRTICSQHSAIDGCDEIDDGVGPAPAGRFGQAGNEPSQDRRERPLGAAEVLEGGGRVGSTSIRCRAESARSRRSRGRPRRSTTFEEYERLVCEAEEARAECRT